MRSFISSFKLILPIDCDEMQLYCSKPALEINQFAVEAVRPGPVATFFPKPLFKTLKFQRRTKNLGKHLPFSGQPREKQHSACRAAPRETTLSLPSSLARNNSRRGRQHSQNPLRASTRGLHKTLPKKSQFFYPSLFTFFV